MSGTSPVIVQREGRVAVITLNRPSKKNAINQEMVNALVDAFDLVETDSEIQAAVLTGGVDGFCAGMDLDDFLEHGLLNGVFDLYSRRLPKPMIAAVEGFAVAGGFELALFCDVVVASQGSKFALPESKIGLIAAAGGIIRLQGKVGANKAAEILLTGDYFSAEDLAVSGMINHITERGAALEKALQLARSIASNAPNSVRSTLDVMRHAAVSDEVDAWAYQANHWENYVRDHTNAREGVAAYLERRPPNWQ